MADISTIDINGVSYNIKDVTARNGVAQLVTDLANYYTKQQVYNKTEIDQIVSGIRQFTPVVANSLPTASAETMYKLYLIPSTNPETQNTRDEYITISSTSGGTTTYAWEQIGSTAIDLSDYSTTEEMNQAIASAIATALEDYLTSEQVEALIDDTKDEVDEKLTSKADVNGEYQEMKVGQATTSENVASAMEDSPMFTFRKTPVAANVLRIDEIKGNSVAWNQLFAIPSSNKSVTNEHGSITDNRDGSFSIVSDGANASFDSPSDTFNVNVVSGHKYMFLFGGSNTTYWLRSNNDDTFGSGGNVYQDGVVTSTITKALGFKIRVGANLNLNKKVTFQCIDLTALSLPNLTAPQFKALYGGFHGFNPGTIKNLTTFGMRCTGLNQWDEQWEVGSIDHNTGAKISGSFLRSVNYIPVISGKEYYFMGPNKNYLYGYDGNKNYVKLENATGWKEIAANGGAYTIPEGVCYILFVIAGAYGTTYKNDICINISGARNGEYEPYHEEIVYTNIGGGFNRWNEQWQLGEIDNTGAVVSGNRVVSKDFIPVQGNTDYYFYQGTIATGSNIAPVWYDANKAFISGNTFAQNGIVKSPANARYLKFRMAVDYGTTYHQDICISYDVPGLNGTYQPYTVLTGKLNGQGESVELFTEGAKVVNNVHDLIRRNDCDVVMEEVDLGNLTWTKGAASTNEKDIFLSNNVLQRVASNTNVLCARFMFGGLITTQQQALNFNDGQFFMYSLDNVPGVIGVVQTHGRYADANAFKLAMAGVKLVSQLANPKHYILDTPLNLMAKTDPDGTQMLLPPQTGMSEPTSAPMLAEIEYYVNAMKGIVNVETLKNLLDSFKAANKISSYTMTWNDATGEYDFTIS